MYQLHGKHSKYSAVNFLKMVKLRGIDLVGRLSEKDSRMILPKDININISQARYSKVHLLSWLARDYYKCVKVELPQFHSVSLPSTEMVSSDCSLTRDVAFDKLP